MTTPSKAHTVCGMAAPMPPPIFAKPAARLSNPAAVVGNKMLSRRTTMIPLITRHFHTWNVVDAMSNAYIKSQRWPPPSHRNVKASAM
jgi:hypothetical protein